MDLLFEMLKLGTVGVIAGFFSFFLANTDHRNRKWWELRVKAYQDAIEALSDIVYYFDKHWGAMIESRDLSDEYKAKIKKFMDDAGPKARRAADSGAFLFSDRANAALKEFIKDENYQTYFDVIDGNLAKAKVCLDELVACSKEDLRLREPFWVRWVS